MSNDSNDSLKVLAQCNFSVRCYHCEYEEHEGCGVECAVHGGECYHPDCTCPIADFSLVCFRGRHLTIVNGNVRGDKLCSCGENGKNEHEHYLRSIIMNHWRAVSATARTSV